MCMQVESRFQTFCQIRQVPLELRICLCDCFSNQTTFDSPSLSPHPSIHPSIHPPPCARRRGSLCAVSRSTSLSLSPHFSIHLPVICNLQGVEIGIQRLKDLENTPTPARVHAMMRSVCTMRYMHA